jgi:hypothetical protein
VVRGCEVRDGRRRAAVRVPAVDEKTPLHKAESAVIKGHSLVRYRRRDRYEMKIDTAT